MSTKIGKSSQIINFNFVHNFVSENLNNLLWNMFSPGVLSFTYVDPPLVGEIEITDFSALVRPRNKEFLVKVDSHTSLKIVADPNKPYLVARMDYLSPPNGYDYESASYGVSGYSGYFENNTMACLFSIVSNNIQSLSDHNLVVGDVVRFTLTIGGIIKDTDYYVVESNPPNNFKVSATVGGSAVTIISADNNSYKKMNSHIVRFDIISKEELDSTYDIVLAVLGFTSGQLTSVDITNQTQVYLYDNCINYDVVQRSGVRTLEGTNTTYINYDSAALNVKNTSGNVPRSNSALSHNLNAQYLNGITVGNSDNNIALKNNILSTNMVGARLFLNGFEYGIGQSGLTSYSGFSGYSGISGWSGASGYSSYSGYLPVSNLLLQTSLNAEYLGGYKLTDFSLVGHTHNLDEIGDGETYKKIMGVDTDGYVTTDGISDKVLQNRHQSTTTPFLYDGATAQKLFMLAGQIGVGGSTAVTFRKTFVTPPKVFILNNESGDWKAVNEASISTTGFTVNHVENTSGTNLVGDSTGFSTHWLAVGEII